MVKCTKAWEPWHYGIRTESSLEWVVVPSLLPDVDRLVLIHGAIFIVTFVRVGRSVGGATNVVFNNTAPIFYSALQDILPSRWAEAYEKKVAAMNDRFTVRYWINPLPRDRRVIDFPHCASCFASFVLDNDAAWNTGAGS